MSKLLFQFLLLVICNGCYADKVLFDSNLTWERSTFDWSFSKALLDTNDNIILDACIENYKYSPAYSGYEDISFEGMYINNEEHTKNFIFSIDNVRDVNINYIYSLVDKKIINKNIISSWDE